MNTNFPSWPTELTPAVEVAYKVLFSIVEGVRRDPQNMLPLSPQNRALANTCILGAWHYDSFMGRKWEVGYARHLDSLSGTQNCPVLW